MMDKIKSISVTNDLSMVRSRIFFLFSNLIQSPDMTEAIMSKDLFSLFFALTEDMIMIEKEPFFFLILNGILTLRDSMLQIDSIGDILSDIYNRKLSLLFIQQTLYVRF